MSNYQPQVQSPQQPQMQPVMMPNAGQPTYGPNPYQVMDNPAQYVQYNQGNMPGQPVQTIQAPAQESFLDKAIKGIISFIAKLSGQPDPKTGTGASVVQTSMQQPQMQQVGQGQPINQQYQQAPQYAQQPMQQSQEQYQPPIQQSGGIVGNFIQGVSNVAQNVGNMGQQVYEGVQSGVQKVENVGGQVVNTGKDLYQGAKETAQEITQTSTQEAKKEPELNIPGLNPVQPL